MRPMRYRIRCAGSFRVVRLPCLASRGQGHGGYAAAGRDSVGRWRLRVRRNAASPRRPIAFCSPRLRRHSRHGRADAWDSGKVSSNQTTGVGYAGKALQPLRRYYWQVQVWDQAGRAFAGESSRRRWSPGCRIPGMEGAVDRRGTRLRAAAAGTRIPDAGAGKDRRDAAVPARFPGDEAVGGGSGGGLPAWASTSFASTGKT